MFLQEDICMKVSNRNKIDKRKYSLLWGASAIIALKECAIVSIKCDAVDMCVLCFAEK